MTVFSGYIILIAAAATNTIVIAQTSRHFNLPLAFRRVLTQGCRSLGLGQMRGNSW